MDEYQESYWEDDLYQYNQNEADDYRHENDAEEAEWGEYDEMDDPRMEWEGSLYQDEGPW